MKAGYCGGIGGIFSTFSTLRLSKTAGFCEQDVKSLAFFLYRSVVQLKKERERKFLFPHISKSVGLMTVFVQLNIFFIFCSGRDWVWYLHWLTD